VTRSNEQEVALIKALPGAGHVSAAIIYVTMGALAGLVAIGARSHTPDLRGTMRALLEQPFGIGLLLVVALGSMALTVWRLLQAFADLEAKGKTLVGLAQRGRYLISGVFYGAMPILVWRMFVGAPVYSSDHWARRIATDVIALPFGWTLLVATGLGFFAYAAVCAYRLVLGNFDQWFECENMTRRQRWCLLAFGRLGYAARGSIAGLVGYFILLAGWHLNPYEAAGQASALYRVLPQPFGPLFLGIIAIGLIGLGFFSLASARFGKLPVARARNLVRSCRRQIQRSRLKARDSAGAERIDLRAAE
jgi:hypothetical protein